jgi:hypothetical protein
VTSPRQPDRAAALGTAQTLATALDGMAAQLKAVKKSALRTRLGLGLDILLTIIIALLAWQNSSTSGRVVTADARAASATAAAMALHSAQVTGCQSGNQERAGEMALWTYLFHASKSGSKAQQEAVAKFMVLVGDTFAPRNCSALYSLTPPKGDSRG